MKEEHHGRSPRAMEQVLPTGKWTPAVTFLALLFAIVFPAHGWSSLGHETVARLAQGMISNSVRVNLERILGTNDLGAVAMWPDELREALRNHSGPLVHDAEATNFNHRFPNSPEWHFAKLPLKSFKYLTNGAFASTNDVVHALDRCIDVLQNRSRAMTKVQALRWVIHLVGDIHQPLHVGVGYYEFPTATNVHLLLDPTSAAGH